MFFLNLRTDKDEILQQSVTYANKCTQKPTFLLNYNYYYT